MRHTFLKVVLSLGVIFGIGAGIASIGCHRHGYHGHHRAEFEQHIADVCVAAALRAQEPRAK